MWDGPIWYVKLSPWLAHLIWTNSLNGLESPGLGLALEGLGLVKPQARPYKRAWAWLRPGSGPGQGLFRPGLGPGLRAQARAYETKH